MAALDVTELLPGLWIGSAPPRGPMLGQRFDVVVLCAVEWPPRGKDPAVFFPGVEALKLPLLDGPMTPEVAAAAEHMADRIARRVRTGRRVLVTCMAGRNRSGLVAALAVKALMGWPGRKASEHVRKWRLNALSNPAFREYVER